MISGWGTQGRCRYSARSIITRFDFMAPGTRIITALQCIKQAKLFRPDFRDRSFQPKMGGSSWPDFRDRSFQPDFRLSCFSLTYLRDLKELSVIPVSLEKKLVS